MMQEEDKMGFSDYLLVTYGTIPGLAVTIANAVVCRDTWQTLWIISAVISVICYMISWVLNFKVKDGFGVLGMYMIYSFAMFLAGIGTAMFTWGEDMWIIILCFPFGLIGLAVWPFAIIAVCFMAVCGIVECYNEQTHKINTNPKRH